MMKKKVCFLVVVIVVCVIGVVLYKNFKIDSSNELDPDFLPAVGKVLSYTAVPTYGTADERENIFMIELYSYQTLKYGYFHDENLKEKVLSESQYNEIINLAFGDKFNKMPDDIGNKRIMDGSRKYVNVYYQNGLSRKIGGVNPKNDTFEQLVDLLLKYAK